MSDQSRINAPSDEATRLLRRWFDEVGGCARTDGTRELYLETCRFFEGGASVEQQSLEEIQTLAVKLFKASQAQKRRQPKGIWHDQGRSTFTDLPSESVAVWIAVAICAYDTLRKAPPTRGRRMDGVISPGIHLGSKQETTNQRTQNGKG